MLSSRAVARPVGVSPTKFCVTSFKMVVPTVSSGIEEVDDFAGVRVNARKVRAFEEVATVTCKCQSFQIVQVIIVRRVLFGDHMLDMKRNE